MQRKLFAILALLVILLAGVGPVAASPALSDYVTSTSFIYNITPSMGSQTDYQVQFLMSNLTGVSGWNGTFNIIYTNGTTQGDWDDVNATDGSNNPLPFWVENHTQTRYNATAWIRVPTISVANNSVGKWYYGNATQTASTMNGYMTFLEFDDFNGASFNTTQWTVNALSTATQTNGYATISTTQTAGGGVLGKTLYGYNVSYKARGCATSTGSFPRFGFIDVNPNNHNIALIYPSGTATWHLQTGMSDTFSDYTLAPSADTAYHTYEIARNGSIRVLGRMDTNMTYQPAASNIPTATLYSSLSPYNSAANIVGDWVFVRKFVASEPTITMLPSSPLAPVASFTTNASSGVTPLSILFTDTSINTPTTWNWSFNNVTGNNTPITFSVAKNPALIFGVGNYSVALNVTNTFGFNETPPYYSWVNVSAQIPTVSSFTANVTYGVPPLVVNLVDTSSDTPTSWFWEFGDGTTSFNRNNVYTYVSTGNYTVNLTVSNSVGSNTSTQYITVVNASPSLLADFSASNTNPALLESVSFSDLSSGTPTTWNWSFGDGTNSTSQNPSHAYSTTGLKTVFLNVSNASGSFSQTQKTNYINVTANGTASINTQDIVMAGAYNLVITVTATDTGLVIPGVAVTDMNNQTATTDAIGVATLTEPFSTVAGTLVATGYVSRSWSIVVDNDTWVTYQMTPATAPGQKNTWYTMQLVRIKVVDAFGVPLPKSTLTARYLASTLPSTDVSWLVSAFGVDTDVATQMVNSSIAMNGSTSNDGSLSFMMFPALTYGITISNASIGLNNYRELSPRDTDYTIYCPLASQRAVNNTLNASLTTSLPFYRLNTTGGYNLSMIYYDPDGYTTNLHFIVKDYTHGRATVYDHNWGNPGTNVIVDNYTVVVPMGQEYTWTANATKI